MIAKSDGAYDSKYAIMPSKNAAIHDSKKYCLKFLSNENGKSQLNFYNHFMPH